MPRASVLCGSMFVETVNMLVDVCIACEDAAEQPGIRNHPATVHRLKTTVHGAGRVMFVYGKNQDAIKGGDQCYPRVPYFSPSSRAVLDEKVARIA